MTMSSTSARSDMKKIKRVVLATGKLISGGLNSYWIGIAKPQARVISTFPGERKHVVSDQLCRTRKSSWKYKDRQVRLVAEVLD